jgi:hypothetical protein
MSDSHDTALAPWRHIALAATRVFVAFLLSLALRLFARLFWRPTVSARLRSFTVSTTALVVVEASLDRTRLEFGVANAGGNGSVMVADGLQAATVTNGYPVSEQGGPFIVEGQAARRRWTAIRLVAADTQLGVMEYFPDHIFTPPADPGVPS